MQWQFYPSLGLKWTKDYDKTFNIYANCLILGCFQFRWYSKG